MSIFLSVSTFDFSRLNNGYRRMRSSTRNFLVVMITSTLGFTSGLFAEELELSLEIDPDQQVVELSRESASFTPEDSMANRRAISGTQFSGEFNKLNRVADSAQNLPTVAVPASGGLSGSTVNFAGTQFNQVITGNTVGN